MCPVAKQWGQLLCPVEKSLHVSTVTDAICPICPMPLVQKPVFVCWAEENRTDHAAPKLGTCFPPFILRHSYFTVLQAVAAASVYTALTHTCALRPPVPGISHTPKKDITVLGAKDRGLKR